MVVVLQRVREASVTVDSGTVAKCEKGFLLLLGVAAGDTEDDCRLLADKISKLRVFPDEASKMNLSVNDVSGSAIVVPNFTLLASCRKGNRPDFFASAPPHDAKALFEYFTEYISNLIPNVGAGIFGADMKVELCNDGPVTIVIDSAELRKKSK